MGLKIYDFQNTETLSITPNNLEPHLVRNIELKHTEHIVSSGFETTEKYPVQISFVIFNGAKNDVLEKQMEESNE